MRASQLLFSQGFGTRRDCHALVLGGALRVGGQVVDDPDAELDENGLAFEVDGAPWRYQASALVLLHKPAGYECSQKPRHHPSVLTLLPAPLRARGVQPVGRLDEDTTGLLLLTADGALIHKLTSPKHHVAKVYEVLTKHPVTPQQVQALKDGVVLNDERHHNVHTRADDCEATGEHALRLTLTEGKYHQVKRMVAAAGNRVEGLHRSRFGALELPPGLAPGRWCWVDDAQRSALTARP